MKVRALTTFVAESGAHQAGEVFDVSADDAGEWLRAGLIERLAPEVETATRQPPEAAVTRKGRR
jgi:maltose-binding protein MalE